MRANPPPSRLAIERPASGELTRALYPCPRLSIITATGTLTRPAVTSTTTAISTSTITVSVVTQFKTVSSPTAGQLGNVGLQPRHAEAEAEAGERAVELRALASLVPTYATQMCDAAHYASACACWGIDGGVRGTFTPVRVWLRDYCA